MESKIDQLERLAVLHRDGSLSASEYETEKRKLLGSASIAEPEAPAPGSLPAKVANSKSWQARFEFFDTHGPMFKREGREALKGMPLGRRVTITFNIWAFLLGPIYLLWLGMWRRAVGQFVTLIVLGLVLEQVLGDRIGGYAEIGLWSYFAAVTNWWFYVKAREGRDEWSPVKDIR